MTMAAFPRSVTASVLLLFLAVLGTGLPSHHHDAGPPPDRDARVSADQHSHGTQLVEQDDRTPSTTPVVVATGPLVSDFVPAAIGPENPVERDVLRPMERAPPPGAPRAPPLSA